MASQSSISWKSFISVIHHSLVSFFAKSGKTTGASGHTLPSAGWPLGFFIQRSSSFPQSYGRYPGSTAIAGSYSNTCITISMNSVVWKNAVLYCGYQNCHKPDPLCLQFFNVFWEPSESIRTDREITSAIHNVNISILNILHVYKPWE